MTCFCTPLYKCLNLIRNVWNYLNSFSKILTTTFFADNRLTRESPADSQQ